MDHVAACCSRNGKHLRGCPSQWSPGFRRLQERRSSLLVLPLTVLEESGGGGWEEGVGVESSPCPALRAAWVIVPRWGLSTPVSFRSALRALHPHSWDAWRPRVHLLHRDSITCQTPSVSPGAETFSTHLPLRTHMPCACPNIEAGPSVAMFSLGQLGPTGQRQLQGESQEPLNVCPGPWDLSRILSRCVVAWGAGGKNWAIGLAVLKSAYRLAIAKVRFCL